MSADPGPHAEPQRKYLTSYIIIRSLDAMWREKKDLVLDDVTFDHLVEDLYFYFDASQARHKSRGYFQYGNCTVWKKSVHDLLDDVGRENARRKLDSP